MSEKLKIIKSNKLINAREKKPLSALEQKILLNCILKVSEDSFTKELEFSISDIFDRKELSKREYDAFRKACSVLISTAVAFEEYEDGECTRSRYISIFDTIDAIKKTGKGIFVFNNSMKEHVVGLKNNFTIYNYKHIQLLNSGFAIRIYELLIQGKNKYRSREFSIDALLDVLSLTESKSYHKFSNIKRLILDKSCNEITEKTDINCSWEVSKKEGRKITHIMFVWQYKEGLYLCEQKEEKTEGKKELIQIQVQDSSSYNEIQPTESVPMQQTENNTDRSQEEKKTLLLTRLMELGLTIDEAHNIVQKTNALPESGIWKAINAVKMGLKDGIIKNARAVLLSQFLS